MQGNRQSCTRAGRGRLAIQVGLETRAFVSSKRNRPPHSADNSQQQPQLQKLPLRREAPGKNDRRGALDSLLQARPQIHN